MTKTHEDLPPPHWVAIDRGMFVIGRCVACGWEAPARRAHHSAHEDMVKHHRKVHGYEGKAKHLDTVEVKVDKDLKDKAVDKKVAEKVKARLKKLRKKG